MLTPRKMMGRRGEICDREVLHAYKKYSGKRECINSSDKPHAPRSSLESKGPPLLCVCVVCCDCVAVVVSCEMKGRGQENVALHLAFICIVWTAESDKHIKQRCLLCFGRHVVCVGMPCKACVCVCAVLRHCRTSHFEK